MSTTYEESILAYVFGIVSAVPNATAFRTREEAISLPEGIAIIVAPERNTFDLKSSRSDMALVDFIFLITVIARGGTTIPESVGDPIRLAVHKAVMADKTMGGRTALTWPHSTDWTAAQADQTAATIEMRFIARYLSNTSDITAPV